MEKKHRQILTEKLPTLVSYTGKNELNALLDKLTEQKIFTSDMIERYQVAPNADLKNCVRQFYIDIQSRGPNAFKTLVESLNAIGQWDLVRLLSPDDCLNNPFTSTTFHSLKVDPVLDKRVTPTIVDENTDRVRTINVKKATSFGMSPHGSIPCYSMKSSNRGYVLMINIINFENNMEPRREGAEKDAENLRELFEQIGFKFYLETDLKKKDLEDKLRTFSKNPELRKIDCLFVIIASHGFLSGSSETSMSCSDLQRVSNKKIIDYFNSENCIYLHNIPKVFIFQLCRGEKFDFGHESTHNNAQNYIPYEVISAQTQSDGAPDVNERYMRHYSDMLIVHSTVPGFKSHRDRTLGCWYFISLCEVFMEHCHNTHLDDLFKLVDEHLRNIYLKKELYQTSSIEFRGFNRYCFLNPGLFEDSLDNKQ